MLLHYYNQLRLTNPVKWQIYYQLYSADNSNLQVINAELRNLTRPKAQSPVKWHYVCAGSQLWKINLQICFHLGSLFIFLPIDCGFADIVQTWRTFSPRMLPPIIKKLLRKVLHGCLKGLNEKKKRSFFLLQAALIMQVLSLTDQQIALLPEDQRQSIMVLKEQIAQSAPH